MIEEISDKTFFQKFNEKMKAMPKLSGVKDWRFAKVLASKKPSFSSLENQANRMVPRVVKKFDGRDFITLEALLLTISFIAMLGSCIVLVASRFGKVPDNLVDGAVIVVLIFTNLIFLGSGCIYWCSVVARESEDVESFDTVKPIGLRNNDVTVSTIKT